MDILKFLCEVYYHVPESYYKRKEINEQDLILQNSIEKLKMELDTKKQKMLDDVLYAQQDLYLFEGFEYFYQGICCGVQLYEEVNQINLKELYNEKCRSNY